LLLYPFRVRRDVVTAKIPTTIRSKASEYAQLSAQRNHDPPMAMNRIPQAKVLKAPRSYFSGLLALIPARAISQTP